MFCSTVLTEHPTVRTVEQGAIYLVRQQYTDTLDVYGLGTTLEESKYLIENVIGLDYCYFFVAKLIHPLQGE